MGHDEVLDHYTISEDEKTVCCDKCLAKFNLDDGLDQLWAHLEDIHPEIFKA